jgi:pimeloyl-ACP methyl ester carboxylesterase
MTTRPLSQLIHARIQKGTGSPRIITLHDHNQHARDVAGYGLVAGPDARVIGLESYKGVFVGKEIVGYTWFIGPAHAPSPLFFGDALAEIERFLWDEIDRQGGEGAELPFLIGVGQGAIMAIAAAAAVPDLLSGVIAIDGFLPIVPGWEPPLAPLDDLPIQLIERAPTEPGDTVLSGDQLVSTLRAWGGDVTHINATPGDIPANAISAWITRYSPRVHRS